MLFSAVCLRHSCLDMAETKSSVHHFGGVSGGNILSVLNDITPNSGRVTEGGEV